MKNEKSIDLGLTAYDEMFMTDQERAESKLPRIYDLPLNQIDDFPDHPFQVRMVDEGKIAMRPAVEISYLTKKEQQYLVDAIEYADCTPSHAQAIRMRAFSRDGLLGQHVIDNILNEEKPNQVERISLRYNDARRYIPANVPYNKTGEYILKALEFYQKHLERQRDSRDAR